MIKKNKLRGVILAITCGLISWVSVSAQAALHIELTQGLSKAIPLGVSGFAVDPNDPNNNQTLKTIITNDLQNSGQVAVQSDNSSTSAPDLSYWRQQKVDYLLNVTVQQSGSQYQVNAQLLNVFGAGNNSQSSAPLFNQSFKVSPDGVRTLAHHISDLVYQQLTGVRGIFSTKVAYVLVQRQPRQTQYSLEVADADGYNPRRLLTSSQPVMSPAWSPDGRSLAYVSFEGYRAAIYLQDVRTGQRSVISRYPGINGAPAFSPDGRQLALVLTRTDNPKIYLMDLGSKQLTQVTDGNSIDTEPDWSPDGRSLIFTSNRDGSNPQIYRYDLATKQVSRVTTEGEYNARASFVPPSGQQIVLMNRDGNLFAIAKQSINGGGLQLLTAAGEDESPSVAPNGKMIIYATQYGGRGMLAVVSLDGRVKLRLPAREGEVQEPAWSPFL